MASEEAQSVAQRKAFLGQKLSGSFADPLQQKKVCCTALPKRGFSSFGYEKGWGLRYLQLCEAFALLKLSHNDY